MSERAIQVKKSAGAKSQKGKKNRKIGKKRAWCKAYRASGRREINKLKKLKRHLKQARHANDQCAIDARKNLRSYEIMR